jgi:hypothetical protein
MSQGSPIVKNVPTSFVADFVSAVAGFLLRGARRIFQYHADDYFKTLASEAA